MMRILSMMCLVLLAGACKTKGVKVHPVSAKAPLIIYQTKEDYSQYVPVTLSDNKAEIVAYPHPKDVIDGDDYRLPVKLKDGFYLDQQGINVHVAFLTMTYADYAKLTEPLPLNSMLKMIRDADPITAMYQVGFHGDYKDVVKEINAIIKKGELESKGTKLK